MPPNAEWPRIAVVDDDLLFVELMRDLLADGEGYEVVSNAQWVRSLDFVKETRPDLVILDLMMGREPTGWAVLDLLRADASTADIPVIVCSAAAEALHEQAPRIARAGRVTALAKPFDLDDLLGAIARLLAPRAAPAAQVG